MADEPSQLDKLKEAARDLETDNDPERFKKNLMMIVRHKPANKAGDKITR